MKMTILDTLRSFNRNLRNPMNRAPSPCRSFMILSILACFAFLPRAQGQCLDGCNGNFGTFQGDGALIGNTIGSGNTALGWRSLFSNTDGSFNTGVGAGTLVLNNAESNTAVGAAALLLNTTGSNNTAVGTDALVFNDSGAANTATGAFALFSNTTGIQNVAVGSQALNKNTTGFLNNAVGNNALFANTTGSFNNAFGTDALANNTTGEANNAFGDGALASNVTGNSNTAIGDLAGSNITGSGNVCIGQGIQGAAGVDNETRIRNIYTTVQPAVGIDPDFVTVNSVGRLGRSNLSSRRYKHDIKPMDKASEALFKLNPVSFRYNKEYDATQTIAFGLVAEDVAEVYPDLVGRNPEGRPESVRYEQINAMLLNEFLKGHRKAQQQEATIAELKKGIEVLTAQLKEQAAQIQKVSAQLELNNSAARTVASDQ